jgi:cation:H+ antiporter
MFSNLALVIAGFALLIFGAHSLIKGASSVAKRAGLSNLFIGLTIVAFGTSLPELTANIFATIRGNFDIAVGEIIGSNISNVLLVLGVSALIFPLVVRKSTVTKQIPYNLLAIFVLFILANDILAANNHLSFLNRTDGLIMIILFGIFIYYTFINRKVSDGQEGIEFKRYSYPLSLTLIIGGMVMLMLGGDWAVDGAVAIATSLGVSEALIGLTVVALGTSLAELVTSATAAFKRNSDIAIGNIIGSNVFNIFWVLGLSSLIRPLEFLPLLNYDILIFTAAMFILLAFMFVGKKNILQRWQGAVLVVLYVIYIIYLILRG